MKRIILAAILCLGFCNFVAMADTPAVGFGTVTLKVLPGQLSQSLYAATIIGYKNNVICGQQSKNIHLFQSLTFSFGPGPGFQFCPQGADNVVFQACNGTHCAFAQANPTGSCTITASAISTLHHVNFVYSSWTSGCGPKPAAG